MRSQLTPVVFEKRSYLKDTFIYRADRIYPVYGCVIIGRISTKGKKRWLKFYPNYEPVEIGASYNWLLFKASKLFEAGEYSAYSVIIKHKEYTS